MIFMNGVGQKKRIWFILELEGMKEIWNFLICGIWVSIKINREKNGD